MLIIPNAFAESVPEWVKNTAGWWATDQISETEFVNAVEFLVKENIIQVNVSQTSETSDGVPEWVKNTAGWWATNQISETEFVNAVEFLVKENIIQVNVSQTKFVAIHGSNSSNWFNYAFAFWWCISVFGGKWHSQPIEL